MAGAGRAAGVRRRRHVWVLTNLSEAYVTVAAAVSLVAVQATVLNQWESRRWRACQPAALHR